jgi:hypothetical protein
LKKLEEAMESRVYRHLREVGSILVRKLSVIALKWGNKSARNWAVDYGFMRYLVITEMNLSR